MKNRINRDKEWRTGCTPSLSLSLQRLEVNSVAQHHLSNKIYQSYLTWRGSQVRSLLGPPSFLTDTFFVIVFPLPYRFFTYIVKWSGLFWGFVRWNGADWVWVFPSPPSPSLGNKVVWWIGRRIVVRGGRMVMPVSTPWGYCLSRLEYSRSSRTQPLPRSLGYKRHWPLTRNRRAAKGGLWLICLSRVWCFSRHTAQGWLRGCGRGHFVYRLYHSILDVPVCMGRRTKDRAV